MLFERQIGVLQQRLSLISSNTHASKCHTVCVVLIPINPSSVQTQLFIFSAMPKGGKTEETLAVNYVRRDEL